MSIGTSSAIVFSLTHSLVGALKTAVTTADRGGITMVSSGLHDAVKALPALTEYFCVTRVSRTSLGWLTVFSILRMVWMPNAKKQQFHDG